MEKPKVVASQLLFHGFLDVHQDLLERSDGLRTPYTHFTLGGDAVVIVAKTAEGTFIINREYRHPAGNYILGCPGGKVEVGEDPISAGARELFEETGYRAEQIRLLGVSYHMPANCGQKIYFLTADNARLEGPQKLEPFEFIRPELMTLEEIREEIRKGTPVDSHLLASLGFFHLLK